MAGDLGDPRPGSHATTVPVRLDRLLAQAGLGSRRDVRRIIQQGRVAVNGETQRDPGRHVRPGQDDVTVDGRPLDGEPAGPVTLMLNKPRGVITATRDALAPTVLDLLPASLARRVFPAGRLDKDTEGLLILTDDGQLCHRLISPRHGVEKEYEVVVDGPLSGELVERFAAGLHLADGYVTRPAELAIVRPEAPGEARVILTEGRYHQVKRMFAAVGLRVVALRRERIGGLRLDPSLAPGEYRFLTASEVRSLLELPARDVGGRAGQPSMGRARRRVAGKPPGNASATPRAGGED